MPCGVHCGQGENTKWDGWLGWLGGIGKVLWGAQLPALNSYEQLQAEYCLVIVQL